MLIVWIIVTCLAHFAPVWLVLKVDWPKRIENEKREPTFGPEQKPGTYG